MKNYLYFDKIHKDEIANRNIELLTSSDVLIFLSGKLHDIDEFFSSKEAHIFLRNSMPIIIYNTNSNFNTVIEKVYEKINHYETEKRRLLITKYAAEIFANENKRVESIYNSRDEKGYIPAYSLRILKEKSKNKSRLICFFNIKNFKP